MARLQILELPMVHNGDHTETPYILVIDQWPVDTTEEHETINAYFDDFGKKIGARGILCTDRTIELPANDMSLPPSSPEMQMQVSVGDKPQEVLESVTQALRNESTAQLRKQ